MFICIYIPNLIPIYEIAHHTYLTVGLEFEFWKKQKTWYDKLFLKKLMTRDLLKKIVKKVKLIQGRIYLKTTSIKFDTAKQAKCRRRLYELNNYFAKMFIAVSMLSCSKLSLSTSEMVGLCTGSNSLNKRSVLIT